MSAWVPTTMSHSPLGQRLVRLRVLLFRQRAGEKADARAQGGKERLRVLKVLLGEHFRGRHQRRLKAALPGEVHGPKGHGGLAAAHVALQQPRHGRVHAQIVRHFIERPPLGVRGREGQKFPEILDVFIGKGQLHALARVRAQQRERHLIEQQFLKGDAPARGGEAPRGSRENARCRGRSCARRGRNAA